MQSTLTQSDLHVLAKTIADLLKPDIIAVLKEDIVSEMSKDMKSTVNSEAVLHVAKYESHLIVKFEK